MPPSSAAGKNERSSISIPPYLFKPVSILCEVSRDPNKIIRKLLSPHNSCLQTLQIFYNDCKVIFISTYRYLVSLPCGKTDRVSS